MPKPRPFLSPDCQAGYFHVVSRIVDRQMVFGDLEREKFVEMMRAFEALHGVQVLTFCIMSNHIHLLVHVPRRPEGFDVPFEEVWRRWEAAVGKEQRRLMGGVFGMWRENGCEALIEEWRKRVVARMFSLSEFVKALKQRFSQWHNGRSRRKGVLWESRFKSVMVEDGLALRTMAVYIDLNPVRAGVVKDPAEYRWCGYAEAMAGKRKARLGLARAVFGFGQVESMDASAVAKLGSRAISKALVFYRYCLGVSGREVAQPDGTVVRKGLSAEAVARFEKAHGSLPLGEVLRQRIRHFTDGVMLGAKAFVEQWAAGNRWIFEGKSREGRTKLARKIRLPGGGGKLLGGLHALRALVAGK